MTGRQLQNQPLKRTCMQPELLVSFTSVSHEACFYFPARCLHFLRQRSSSGEQTLCASMWTARSSKKKASTNLPNFAVCRMQSLKCVCVCVCNIAQTFTERLIFILILSLVFFLFAHCRTRKAMGGSMPFKRALTERLSTIRCSREQVNKLITDHPPQLTPGIRWVKTACLGNLFDPAQSYWLDFSHYIMDVYQDESLWFLLEKHVTENCICLWW